jgi:hypothetical protein
MRDVGEDWRDIDSLVRKEEGMAGQGTAAVELLEDAMWIL